MGLQSVVDHSKIIELALIRHSSSPARPASPPAVGNGTVPKATPHSPEGDGSYVGASERTACSGARGFRSRRPRPLLTVLNYCRIGVRSSALRNLGTKSLRGSVVTYRGNAAAGNHGWSCLSIHPVDMMTDTIKIILQLFLVVGGGIMVGLLAILLFILVGALGAWLAIQIALFKSRYGQRT